MLQWTQKESGTYEGRAGKVRLFTVSWGLTHQRGDQRGYVLRADLPGIRRSAEEVRFATPEDAQARAEKLLDVFLTHVNDNR